MLEKFKERLKAKSTAAGANLSQKRIDAIADRLHKKFPDITEEADYDAKIDDYYPEDVIKDIAKDDDRIRTLENKPKPKEGEGESAKNEPAKDDKPKSEIDELKELVKGLATTVQTLSSEKAAQSRQDKLKAKFKDKVPEKYWSKLQQPEKDEDIDSFVESVSSDYKDIMKDAGGGFQPGRASDPGSGKKADEKLLNSLVDNMMGIQQNNDN